eukprot:COSAG06_NODE_11889_length_1451_cov_3.036243_1_plen_264_part_00
MSLEQPRSQPVALCQRQRRRLEAVHTALVAPASAITAGLSAQRLSGVDAETVVGATEANNAAQDRERNDHYAAHRTIVEYTPGQSMHIFHPRDFQSNYTVNQGWNPEAVPAIVFFPGGGFRACGQTAFYRQAAHLATRGMVAGVCSYKVEAEPTQATREAGIAEAAAAVEFMRKHAVELNVDARRVVASGGSAGGYIAAGACFVPLGSGGPGGAGYPNLAVVRFNRSRRRAHAPSLFSLHWSRAITNRSQLLSDSLSIDLVHV